MFCGKCGNQVPDGTKFCTKCGNKLVVPANSTVELSESQVVGEASQTQIDMEETTLGQEQVEAGFTNQNQQPNMMNQQSNMMSQQPNMMYQQPNMMNQQPNMIYQQPNMMYQQPDMMNQQPIINVDSEEFKQIADKYQKREIIWLIPAAIGFVIGLVFLIAGLLMGRGAVGLLTLVFCLYAGCGIYGLHRRRVFKRAAKALTIIGYIIRLVFNAFVALYGGVFYYVPLAVIRLIKRKPIMTTKQIVNELSL